MSVNRDNYPVAAVRHFVDGKILHDHNRLDNAMCHYAFSAECAIKILYSIVQGTGTVGLGHNAEAVWEELQQSFGILEILDARTGVLMGQTRIPQKLFAGHPVRRYESGMDFTAVELEESYLFAERLTNEIVNEALDGRLEWQGDS